MQVSQVMEDKLIRLEISSSEVDTSFFYGLYYPWVREPMVRTHDQYSKPHEKEKEGTPTKKELYARYPGFYKDFSSNYTKCIEEVLDYNARRRDRAVADYLSSDHIDLKRHFPSINIHVSRS